MTVVFELMGVLAALALGFVFGRVWEIRQQIQQKRLHRSYIARPWQRVDAEFANFSSAKMP